MQRIQRIHKEQESWQFNKPDLMSAQQPTQETVLMWDSCHAGENFCFDVAFWRKFLSCFLSSGTEVNSYRRNETTITGKMRSGQVNRGRSDLVRAKSHCEILGCFCAENETSRVQQQRVFWNHTAVKSCFWVRGWSWRHGIDVITSKSCLFANPAVSISMNLCSK